MEQIISLAIRDTASVQSMANTYFLLFLSALLSFLAALIIRKLNRIDVSLKEQQECLQERDIILFETDAATLDLSITTAVAVRDGKNNGNLTTALKEAYEAKERRTAFLTRMAQKALFVRHT